MKIIPHPGQGIRFSTVYPLFQLFERDAMPNARDPFEETERKKKSEALEWELTERQVSSWVHNTPFLLRGLLVVINETSSSGPGTMPILVRIGRSFGPGAQSFPLQVVKDFGQGPSSSFVAGWATPGTATSTSPHPKGLAPHPFLAVCVLDISGIMSRLLFPPCALH